MNWKLILLYASFSGGKVNARLVKSLAWVFFLAALDWIILLSVAAGHIYLTREMPIGFWNWVVSVQARGTDDWPKPIHHTNAYYPVSSLPRRSFWNYSASGAASICGLRLGLFRLQDTE
jgi:hypothetical protein